MSTRRTFLEGSLRISAGLALAPLPACLADAAPLLAVKMAKAPPVRVPANFTGLGYEMSSVASPGLLDVANRRYVELIKGLGPEGVLRVGGIVANYTRYEANGTSVAERQNTVITLANLHRFAAFLRQIGWSAIWSVNFAQGTVEDAVAEARAVATVLGTRLLALEIGNEINSYDHGQKPFRKAPYNYEIYRKEYGEWHAAIQRAVPHMRFAAPDTTSSGPRSIDWVERMAQDSKGEVQLLTTHYYRNGQNHGTAEQLLYPDPKLKEALLRLQTASQQSGIPWRICETNSFSGGGRPEVSDTFLAALWTLDYMLLLAGYGCSGVNLETGVNQLGFVSSYSPIQDDRKGSNTAGVPYYGMLAFAVARAGCREIMPVELDTHGLNLTAYVLGTDRTPRAVVVVNRDSAHDAQLSIAELGMGSVLALRLLAPSSDSKTGITFGGSSVDAQGQWRARNEERIHHGAVNIPRMSAVVLRSAAQR